MTPTRAAAAPAGVAAGRRHWSDYVGFVFYLGFAVAIVVRSPGLGLLMLPTFLHELLIALSFLLRRPLRRELPGWGPRLAAYGGSFILVVFMPLAGALRPEWLAPTPNPGLRVAGFLLWLTGATLGLWPIWYLRRSFSVEPQARGLVTAGPYRLARHPIYTGYILSYLGLWLGRPTLPLLLALLAWFGLTVARIRYEEAVLAAAFPEYAAYRQRVGAFGPRFTG